MFLVKYFFIIVIEWIYHGAAIMKLCGYVCKFMSIVIRKAGKAGSNPPCVIINDMQ